MTAQQPTEIPAASARVRVTEAAPAPVPSATALAVVALVSGVVYSGLTTSSFSTCPGGFDSSGGYVDASGQPSTVAPLCLSMSFHPQAYVWVIIGLIFVVGVLITRRAADQVAARRVMVRAAILIVSVAVVFAIAHQPAFYSAALDGWNGGTVPLLWFDAHSTISPMK